MQAESHSSSSPASYNFVQLTHTILNMRFAAVLALSLVGAALAAPAPISLQEDGKVMIGRDGKAASLAERNVAELNPRVSVG